MAKLVTYDEFSEIKREDLAKIKLPKNLKVKVVTTYKSKNPFHNRKAKRGYVVILPTESEEVEQ